jgi:hypothetical protein
MRTVPLGNSVAVWFSLAKVIPPGSDVAVCQILAIAMLPVAVKLPCGTRSLGICASAARGAGRTCDTAGAFRTAAAAGIDRGNVVSAVGG